MRDGSDGMKINCMIIHLDRAVTRQDHVAKMRGALPFLSEIVPAVDAYSDVVENAELGSYKTPLLEPRYPQTLSPAEVACFQSHRKC